MLILHILVSCLLASHDYDMSCGVGLILIIDFSNQFNHILSALPFSTKFLN